MPNPTARNGGARDAGKQIEKRCPVTTSDPCPSNSVALAWTALCAAFETHDAVGNYRSQQAKMACYELWRELFLNG